MKKRIISFVLACIFMFSAVPAISADVIKDSPENSYFVSNYQEFIDFLNIIGNGEEIYCQITEDFSAPDLSDAIGGYSLVNVHIEGNGHTVRGLKIQDALFSTFTNSTLRNLTFEGAVVQSSSTKEQQSEMAVITRSIEDKYSNITGCVFNNCKIYLPDADADAAFVATRNQGVVTNCVVSDTCAVESSAQSTAQYRVGGITVENIKGSKVINCVSKISLKLADDNSTCTCAGITVRNEGNVDMCYVNSPYVGENYIVADTSSTGNSVYLKEDNSFVLGMSKTYEYEQVNVLAADMSQNAMLYVANYESVLPLAAEDYPTIWCLENSEPALSFDLKTAQVYFIVDETMKDADLEFSLGAQEVTVKPDEKYYSVAVGKYENGEYLRNRLDITYTCSEDDYKMINNFVYKPVFSYVENFINPYDSKNYSKTFIAAQQNGVENTGSIELLPYCWELSISNLSIDDELVDYSFGGNGTESAPYTINNAYELDVLAHYVSEGKVNTNGLAYNSAYYILKTDLDLSGIRVEPIGTYSASAATAFKGVFDGSSHTIKNLTLAFNDKTNENDYLGLFGYVVGSDDKPAVIKNLNVVNANAETKGNLCGIIAGSVQNAVINGCVTSGIASAGTQVSGVVGYANRSKIYNCGSTASLTTASANASAGGIVGYSEYTNVKNCYFAGDIKSYNVVQEDYLKIGSITGYAEGSVFDNCYQSFCSPTDEITSLGGIFDQAVVGISYKSGAELKSDEFLEELKKYTSYSSLDSWWGKDENNINSGYPINADNSLAEYSIICVPTLAGSVSSDRYVALKGTEITITVSSDYDLKELQITNLNREVLDIKCEATQDGKYVFKMPGYTVRVVPVFDAEILLSGKGTEEDPYIIRNYAELNTVANNCYYNKSCPEGCVAYPYAHYELANDVDCGGKTILPMGNRCNTFNGHFNGNGYTISNLKPNPSDAQISHDYAYPAVFGYCGSADIYDLTLQGIELSGNCSAVVASTVWGSTVIRNVTVRDCIIKDSSACGGFVSQCTELTMVNCLADNIIFESSSNCGYIVWNVMEGVSFNNILVCNSQGAEKLIYSSNAILEEDDFTDLYVCGTDVSSESISVKQVDKESLINKDFAAELSENAYYINVDGVLFWGIGTSTELAYEHGVTGIMPIHYDAVFSDDAAYQVFEETVTASEINSTVKISVNPLADFSDLTIRTASGKNIGVAMTDSEDSECSLTFVMPDEPVYIGNSGMVPNPVIPGNGTESDPYIISIPKQLQVVSLVTNGLRKQVKDADDVDYIEAYFTVVNDLDMNNWDWYGIGTYTDYFQGTFDGGFCTISGLNGKARNEKAVDLCGLFYVLGENAVVKNIYIDDAYSSFDASYLHGIEYHLGIVAKLNYGKISKCIITNSTVTSWYSGSYPNRDIGGVVGNNCEGGIIEDTAFINSTLDDWYVKSDSFIRYRGAFVNTNNGIIRNCYVYNVLMLTGNFDGQSIAYYGNGEVINSYAYMDPKSDCYSGSYDSNPDRFISGEIAYLLNGGVTDGTQVWYQNIDNGEPAEEYPTFEKNGINTVYKNIDASYTNIYVETVKITPENVSLRPAENAQLSAVVTPDLPIDKGVIWSSSDTSVVTVNDDGVITAVSCGVAEITAVSKYNSSASDTVIVQVSFEKSPEGYYIIHNYDELLAVAQLVNSGNAEYTDGHFIVGNDFDCSQGEDWSIPIGTEEVPFTGVFDGMGCTVSGLTASSAEKEYFGLFGMIKGAEIRNLNLDVNFNLAGNQELTIGGLCGCVGTGISSDTDEQFPSSVYNCTVNGTINVDVADSLGGICGQLRDYSVLEKCINKCNITSEDTAWIGGVAGVSRSLINNCANWGNISCVDGWRAGGINAGDASGINVITNSYNVGEITGTYTDVGEISVNTNNISNCYYLYAVNTTQGKTTEQFASGEVAYLLNCGATDGTQVWYQNIDNGEPADRYPVFEGGTVYKNVECNGDFIAYSNTEVIAEHDFNNYHVCKKCIGLREGEIAGIYGFSISLGGNIAVKYYMVLDDCVLEDENAKMVFTVPDTGSAYTLEIPVSEAAKSGQFYVFTCEVSAKEMTSDIYCQIVAGDRESDNFRYSVKEYAEVILENADVYEYEIPLVKAMLNYGAYAQEYFDYNTDNLANDTPFISEAEKELPSELDLSEYAFVLSGEEAGVTYYGSALSLKSETAIKHYFIVEGNAEAIEVTVNGEKAELTKNGNLYELKIPNIPAHRLSDMYEIKVGSLTLNYGVFSYGYDVMNGTKDTLKNVVKAMYLYNQEAIEYIV